MLFFWKGVGKILKIHFFCVQSYMLILFYWSLLSISVLVYVILCPKAQYMCTVYIPQTILTISRESKIIFCYVKRLVCLSN